MVLADSEDHFTCDHCSSLYFPKENRDGVRVMGTPGESDCPLCGKHLVLAWIGKTRALFCESCRGLLIRSIEFSRTIEHLRSQTERPPTTAPPLNKKHLERVIYCPYCGKGMDTHPYAGPSNIVIDNCPTCGVNWLDHAELHTIVHSPVRKRKDERWPEWDVPMEGDVPDLGS